MTGTHRMDDRQTACARRATTFGAVALCLTALAAAQVPPGQVPPGQVAPGQVAPAAEAGSPQQTTDAAPAATPPTAAPATPLENGSGSPRLVVFAQRENRASTRLVYFQDTGNPTLDRSPGHIAIDYGRPHWQDAYDVAVKRLRDGSGDAPVRQRWRLGQDHWTALDAGLPFSLNGTRVPPGHYYLVLDVDRGATPIWRLALLAPSEVAAAGLDAWHVDKRETPPGILVDLEFDERDTETQELDIRLSPDKHDATRAELRIHFGKYRLRAPLQVAIDASPAAANR